MKIRTLEGQIKHLEKEVDQKNEVIKQLKKLVLLLESGKEKSQEINKSI